MDLTGIFLICGFSFVIFVHLAVTFGRMFGWRIAAKSEGFITFSSQHVPRAKIREAFTDRGWILVRDQPGDMMARTKASWRSWGEFVTLRFRDNGAVITSESSFPFQAVDYGKNQKNVLGLMELLKNKGA